MYFFAHLLAGMLIGILLAYLFRESALIPACAIGSILPDLIDKPVGLLLFSETFGSGRIFGHTLLGAMLVLFIGILVYTRYRHIGLILLALATGLYLHQVLDAMWLQPVTWYWPALGPFTGHSRPDFFIDAFWRSITNPTEWLAGGIILALLVIFSVPRFRQRYLPGQNKPGHPHLSLPFLLVITAVVILVITIVIYYGYG